MVFEPKPKSFFKAIPIIVERELERAFPDWNVVRRVVRSCQRIEFMALMERELSCSIKIEN